MNDLIIDWMPELTAREWATILASLRHCNREYSQFGEETGIGALLQKLEAAIEERIP